MILIRSSSYAPGYNSLGYNYGIDVIRGFCILAVMLLHLNIHLPLQANNILNKIPNSLFKILFQSGYYGVITFFVISGFLITTTSLKRWGHLQNIRFDQFYILRFARIIPCLIALLIILSILDIAQLPEFVIHTTSLKEALFSALTFHINWLEAKTGYLPGGWDVLWSLSVEETFYFFFPLLCLLTKTETKLKIILCLFIMLGPFARVAFTHNDIWSDHSYLSCMDGIAFGCFSALVANKINPKKTYVFMILGLILFSLIFFFRKTTSHMGLTSLGLNVTALEFSIALILIALQTNINNSRSLKNSFTVWIAWFGKNSYEIYLTHAVILLLFIQFFHAISFSSPIFSYVIILITCGITGHLVANYYSEPMNKYLRKKFIYSLYTKKESVFLNIV